MVRLDLSIFVFFFKLSEKSREVAVPATRMARLMNYGGNNMFSLLEGYRTTKRECLSYSSQIGHPSVVLVLDFKFVFQVFLVVVRLCRQSIQLLLLKKSESCYSFYGGLIETLADSLQLKSRQKLENKLVLFVAQLCRYYFTSNYFGDTINLKHK